MMIHSIRYTFTSSQAHTHTCERNLTAWHGSDRVHATMNTPVNLCIIPQNVNLLLWTRSTAHSGKADGAKRKNKTTHSVEFNTQTHTWMANIKRSNILSSSWLNRVECRRSRQANGGRHSGRQSCRCEGERVRASGHMNIHRMRYHIQRASTNSIHGDKMDVIQRSSSFNK